MLFVDFIEESGKLLIGSHALTQKSHSIMGAEILKKIVTLQLYATISQWMKKLDVGLVETGCHDIDILDYCALDVRV